MPQATLVLGHPPTAHSSTAQGPLPCRRSGRDEGVAGPPSRPGQASTGRRGPGPAPSRSHPTECSHVLALLPPPEGSRRQEARRAGDRAGRQRGRERAVYRRRDDAPFQPSVLARYEASDGRRGEQPTWVRRRQTREQAVSLGARRTRPPVRGGQCEAGTFATLVAAPATATTAPAPSAVPAAVPSATSAPNAVTPVTRAGAAMLRLLNRADRGSAPTGEKDLSVRPPATAPYLFRHGAARRREGPPATACPNPPCSVALICRMRLTGDGPEPNSLRAVDQRASATKQSRPLGPRRTIS
jgi:hypothetical protein